MGAMQNLSLVLVRRRRALISSGLERSPPLSSSGLVESPSGSPERYRQAKAIGGRASPWCRGNTSPATTDRDSPWPSQTTPRPTVGHAPMASLLH
jgi:hypothetical protein